ncbi:hypothetical protein [Caballeronia sp. KNU42]
MINKFHELPTQDTSPTGINDRTYRLSYRRTSSGRRNNDVLNLSSNVLRLIPVRPAMLVCNAVHDDARAARRQRCNRRANHHRRRHANCDADCHRVRIPAVIVIVVIVVVMIVIVMVVVVMAVVVMAVVVMVVVVMVVVVMAVIVVAIVVVVVPTAAVVTASAVATTTVVIAATVAATTAVSTAVAATTAVSTAAAAMTSAASVAALAHATARMRPHLLATAWTAGVETATAAPPSTAMKTAPWRRVNTRARASAETKRVDTQRRRKKDPGNTGGRKLFCA